jgi:hypothetical protein
MQRFMTAILAGAAPLCALHDAGADVRPASDVLIEWSPCLSGIGASVEAGGGPWRLVGASLEPDSSAPLCGGVEFCPGAPLSGGGGSLIFRFINEAGARVCPPAVRGRVSTDAGDSFTLEACEDTPEGPVQRFIMAGAGYGVCAGMRGPLIAAVDETSNDGQTSDRVTGLGLPNGRPVNIVLTWRKNPPPAVSPRFPNTPGCTTITVVAAPTTGSVGQPYTASFTATRGGGATGVCWDIINGNLPDGLQFNDNGDAMTITGTPTTPGTYSFTVAAFGPNCGNFSCSDQKDYVLVIDATAGPTEPPPQYGGAGSNPRLNYAPGGNGGSSSSESIKGGNCWASAAAPAVRWIVLPFALLALAAMRRSLNTFSFDLPQLRRA